MIGKLPENFWRIGGKTMGDPKVSILVPVYNVESYLDRCVKSLVEQSFRDIEIILINDGSTDASGEICREWAEREPRIRLTETANFGQAHALNLGIRLARGEFIVFVDSDDYVDPDLVRKCLASVREHAADAVAYGRWDVAPEGTLGGMAPKIQKNCYRGRESRDGLLEDLLTYRQGLGMGTCGRMYRLETVRNLVFVPKITGGVEDVLFALEFLAGEPTVSLLGERLYYYCSRENSDSRHYCPDRQQWNNRSLNLWLDAARERNLSQSVIRCLKVRYHHNTLAAMKQILESELSRDGKIRELTGIFWDPVLRSTLTFDVLRREKPRMAIFFLLMKFRCFRLCRSLLKLKYHRRRA